MNRKEETIGETINRLTSIDNTRTEYCPHCERETSHIIVDDDIFEFAVECLICNTVWESDE